MKRQIPGDIRAMMRKRSKLQKKMQMATNHQYRVNILNKIELIENYIITSINTEITRNWTS